MRRTAATFAGTGRLSQGRAGHCIGLSWVIDGSSSPVSGEGAADFSAGLEQELDRIGRSLDRHDRDTSLVDILEEAIASNPERHSGHSADVALARHSDECTRLLVLGGATAIAFRNGDQGEPIPVVLDDRRVDDVAIAERHQFRSAAWSGAAQDTLGELKTQLTTTQGRMQNRRGGYWVAADDPAAALQSRTALLPAFSPTALTADGVPGPFGSVTVKLFRAPDNADLQSALSQVHRGLLEDGITVVGDMAAAITVPHWWDPEQGPFTPPA